MRFSFDWLKRHLITSKTIDEIADILTFLGLEVEEVVNPEKIFKGFVIASVSNVEKHPNADKLRTCIATLADGSQKHIVCGASNLREGLKVVLALPGAVIPASGTVLKKSKIRGVPSEGMLCSLEELGLAAESEGIIELPDDISLSESIANALNLGGGILDISLTPNRGDCFCVRGIARDLAAAGAGELTETPIVFVNAQDEFNAEISIDDDDVEKAAPLFAFRTISGVKNGQSPLWVQNFLKSANMKPISAVVDLANFVMLDIGRPFHVYDLDKIKNKLHIRYAQDGEVFSDLQGKNHKLSSDTLASFSGDDVLCILGIMGSDKCACDENTTNILLESASFDQVYLSTIGNKYNIVSDSRTRFERGVDPMWSIPGLDNVSSLILETCGGKASQITAFGRVPFAKSIIKITQKKLDNLAGFHIPLQDAIEILSNLGLWLISESEESAEFSAPQHRFDLAIEEDLIEEVLRIVGYDSVPLSRLECKKTSEGQAELANLTTITSLRSFACSCGLSEVVSFCFSDPKYSDLFASDVRSRSKDVITITNPISADLAVMRNSLYTWLLINAAKMMRYSNRSCNLFELGPVFSAPNRQELVLAGVRVGLHGERSWMNRDRNVDVFDIKSDLLSCLQHIGIDINKISYDVKNVPSFYHPTRSANVLLGNKLIGSFGELRQNVCSAFDINTTAVAFEIYLDDILKPAKRSYKSTSDKIYQAVDRDFSFVFKSTGLGGVCANDVVSEIRKVSPLIKSVTVFDYYKIDETSIALGISIKIQSDVATLTDLEIKEVCNNVITATEKIGCGLR